MQNHRLNKYWLIIPAVILIVLLLLTLVHDFMSVSYTHSPSPRDLSTSRMPSSA